MRSLLIPSLLLLCLAGLTAEEAPRTLDPKKPADALEIVARVAAEVPLRLADSQALTQAIQTLAAVVQPAPPAPATAAPTAPTAPKNEGTKL